MLEQAILLKLSAQNLAESTTSQLRQEYQVYQQLFQAQPDSEQVHLWKQAAYLSEAIMNSNTQLDFLLPEHVVCSPMLDCSAMDEKIPYKLRRQRVGNILDRLTRRDLTASLGQRLSELERSTDHAIAVSAGLIRYAVAAHMIYHGSPAGKAVAYAKPEDDDIPNQPVQKVIYKESDHMPRVACQGNEKESEQDLQGSVPNRSYAYGFFMPQWVAFDDQNQLLVSDVEEAIALFNATRRYLFALNTAVCLAPYMVVDEEFQTRRYGIMGQLVNQGRALARYQAQIICQTIQRQAALHKLDRGLSLSLPYFNDNNLMIEHYDFDVIPAGMVMFVPAFVVLAVRTQAAKVVQDTRLNRTTRRSLLQGLCILEKAFLR